MKKILKKSFKSLMILGVLSFIAIIISNIIVKKYAVGKLYATADEIPYNRVGLLLGTGKQLQNGDLNLYYKYRIDAAVELYQSGKIDYILVSGDNHSKTYDEPSDMKADLIALGVSESRIFLDYAGFRTLDSVVRSKEIFGQESITVISQPFHNERAVFIGEKKGITTIGFNAQSVSKPYGFRTELREKLARVKMLIDLVFGVKPKFLGEKIVVG